MIVTPSSLSPAAPAPFELPDDEDWLDVVPAGWFASAW